MRTEQASLFGIDSTIKAVVQPLERVQVTAWLAPNAKRRDFSKRAAINAEAVSIFKLRNPGKNMMELDSSDQRQIEFIKQEIKEETKVK